MGPLYHLLATEDRIASLVEVFRVLVSNGTVVAAAISRYASALDGLARKLSLDPRFVKIRNRDLTDGQHRNDTGNEQYFTTAYFHKPEDLRSELESAGFFTAPEKRPSVVQNMRSMFVRMGATEQEIRTLRGIVKALVQARRRRRDSP